MLKVESSPASEIPAMGIDPVLSKQLEHAKEVAREAGKKILELRASEQLEGSSVVLQNGKKIRQTKADLVAGQYIIDELSKRYPQAAFLSQDHLDQYPHWYTSDSVWIINTIDNTKEFEKGGNDFHVQIGLLEGNEVVIGVSYWPATDTFVWAVKGQGAWIQKGNDLQRLNVVPASEPILLHSSSHATLQPYLKEWGWEGCKVITEPLSTTGRLLKIIQREASLYVSLGASPLGAEKKGGVWNYGANVVIAQEAGLILKTLKGQPLNLREPQALLTDGVFITNDPQLSNKIIHSDWKFN